MFYLGIIFVLWSIILLFCVCLRLVPNFSQFKYLSSEILCYNSAEIMDTILTRMRTLLKVRYRQRVLNTFWRARVSLVLECLRILPSGHGCIKIYSLKLLHCNNYRKKLSDNGYLCLNFKSLLQTK